MRPWKYLPNKAPTYHATNTGVRKESLAGFDVAPTP